MGAGAQLLSAGHALAYAAENQAVFGLYLGCAFAPNHKGMPGPADGDAANFLRRQVLSSRNVRGGPVTDWILGGPARGQRRIPAPCGRSRLPADIEDRGRDFSGLKATSRCAVRAVCAGLAAAFNR